MKCLECGKDFDAVRVTARFCSGGCRLAFHRREVSVTKNGLSVTENLSVTSLSVTKDPLSVTKDETITLSVTEDDEIGVPAKVVDVEKDLKLDMKRDLGIYSWSADGIFIRPDITVDQVQTIARLVHAKSNRVCPEFLECR